MKWQGIETAPRDGTRILGYQPAYMHIGDEFVVVTYDNDDEESYPWISADAMRSGRYRITHWASLDRPIEG